MSINVTVKGNPISIKRGKMVTSTTDYEKEEFQKRRLMRLQQVRDQSKEIAKDVRDRVRKHQHKQLSEAEKRSEKELREWKERKLLELQQQYSDCLNNVGLAHTQAALEHSVDNDTTKRKQVNEERSKERGKKAAQQLQIHRNEKNLTKAVPIQQKKFSRTIEDTRASLVANVNKKRKKRHKKNVSADINISTIVSNSEQERTDLDASTDSTTSSTFRSFTKPRRNTSPVTGETTEYSSKTGESRRESTRIDANHYTYQQDHHPRTTGSSEILQEQEMAFSEYREKTVPSKTSINVISDESLRVNLKENQLQEDRENLFVKKTVSRSRMPTEIPMDTRISDRIRSRNFTCLQDKENVFVEKTAVCSRIPTEVPIETRISDRIWNRNLPCNCEKQPNRKSSKNIHEDPIALSKRVSSGEQSSVAIQFPEKPDLCELERRKRQERLRSQKDSASVDEIPHKPTVGLKRLLDAKSSQTDVNKVKYYEHSTRFSKEYIADDSQVHKIDDDSIEVCPSNRSEAPFKQLTFKRDREAAIRGQQAMRKVKVQKDYKEMMQKLPELQKQERIASIGRDKPKFHMGEERLKWYEHERQNRMDNAYEKLFPKAATITISPKTHTEPDTNGLPFKTIDATENPPTLNLGSWDIASHEYESLTRRFQHSSVAMDQAPREFEDVDENIETRRQNLKKMHEKLKVLREQLAREGGTLPKDGELLKLFNELAEMGVVPEETRMENVENGKKSSTATERSSKRNSHRSEARKIVERIVLQNASTQTTPNGKGKPSSSVELEGRVLCSKSTEKISASLSQMCDILNKIAEKKSHICMNSERNGQVPAKTASDVTDKATITEKLSPVEPKSKQKTKATQKTPPANEVHQKTVGTQKTPPEMPSKPKVRLETRKSAKSKTWRERFSQNSTSSTSYASPPETLSFPQAHSTWIDSAARPRSILVSKPKQGNLESSSSTVVSEKSGKIDPQLAKSIRKLLKMSRASVEDLQVSSASDITTPGPSLIDTTENDPLLHLRNVMQYFNVNEKELLEYLNSESEKTTTLNSSDGMTCQIDGGIDKSLSSHKSGGKGEEPLTKYGELVENCAKRIESISAQIDKVRFEKLQMMQQSPQDGIGKDTSTGYYDLPSNSSEASSTTDSTFDQEEFNRKMLEIDYSLAEKLKQKSEPAATQREEGMDDVDAELVRRFRQLLDCSRTPLPKNNNATQFALITESNKDVIKHPVFIPLLLDIPRLPKFEGLSTSNEQSHKANVGMKTGREHPPPSKGLIIARRFNNGITNRPHELSTIVEADSQISSRLRGSKSPESGKSSRQTSPAKPGNIVSPTKHKEGKTMKILEEPETTSRENSEKQKSESSLSPSAVQTVSKSKTKNHSSESSTSELESMETMLRGLGMAWAIPTLKRTQEALALTSSTSSLDVTTKPAETTKVSDTSTSTDISLKNFLQRETLMKLSTSSSSDLSPYLREMENLSAIHESTSKDKTTHRTSTPVPGSKSGDNSKNESQQPHIFSEESEMSSVRAVSEEVVSQQFVSLKSDDSASLYESRTKSD